MRPSNPLRIAMWSGPRNISTALMRAWGNRPDTVVCDEPFYAHYLLVTGREHPGRAETLAAHDADWRRVADALTGPVPDGRRIFYQKHMTHHLLPEMGRDWMNRVRNCFLIREPREMLTSLLKHLPNLELADTGMPQQVEIFRAEWARAGGPPPVIDARDVLENPRGVLGSLCDALGIEFLEAMLSWPPGLRATDGAWAPFWYREVVETTSFGPYRPKPESPPESLRDTLHECERLYEELHAHRLRAG